MSQLDLMKTSEGKKTMKLSFSKELYPKIALLKAAYSFTDKAYLHLDADSSYYYVTLTPKEESSSDLEECFTNEMLAQCVRHEVYLQTKNIRELLVARAMASTVIERTPKDEPTLIAGAEDASSILTDWFDSHDN